MTPEAINKLYIEGEIQSSVYDARMKDFLFACIEQFPDYFWIVPASRREYHYQDEREEGGLVLHVRRLCKLTKDFVRMHELNKWENDILISACILHDSFSRGIPPNIKRASDELHPLYPEIQFPFNTFADKFMDRNTYETIMACVVSHMGRFSVSKSLRNDKKLPSIFHQIDYIGSRDYIRIDL